ncbi:MAG: hypothetical protein IVW56_03105 [Candidatus Binataceae bacterium]|nr:hypothetical protein [Candidatus Binataceae bacterium]
MENLTSQVYAALMDLIHATDGGWIGMPILSKLVLAMFLSGFFVYAGTRAENTGWSTLWFFTAFACIAYLIANGIAIMR